MVAEQAHAVVAAFMEDPVQARHGTDRSGRDHRRLEALDGGAIVVLRHLQHHPVPRRGGDHQVGQRPGRRDWRLDERGHALLREEPHHRGVGVPRDGDDRRVQPFLRHQLAQARVSPGAVLLGDARRLGIDIAHGHQLEAVRHPRDHR